MAKKPANATWVARVKLAANDPNLDFPLEVDDHRFREVEVAWYANSDRVKITLPHGGPAVISQAYLSGDKRDVIIEVVAS